MDDDLSIELGSNAFYRGYWKNLACPKHITSLMLCFPCLFWPRGQNGCSFSHLCSRMKMTETPSMAKSNTDKSLVPEIKSRVEERDSRSQTLTLHHPASPLSLKDVI